MKRVVLPILVLVLLAGGGTAVAGDCREVKMLPGENWWGLCTAFGREMPFDVQSSFACDLRRNNYGHQALSLLVSDKGRAVWCAEPVGVGITNGLIRLESDAGTIIVREKAGANLAEAFRAAAETWFRPSGDEPELLYFSAPQYNTWIELTYHQNEKDILAYAQSMLDHGLPPGIFMIDDTWQAGYGDWRFEPTRFSDPKGMVDALHRMGYKVLLWMCPWVSMDTPAFRRIAWGINPDDVNGYPTTGGFLTVEPPTGEKKFPTPASVLWWNGYSALLDFTHPNACAWFSEQLDGLVRTCGVDGFKFDGGSVSYYAGSRSGGRAYAHRPDVSPAAQSALYGAFALKYRGSEYRESFGFAGKPVIMRLHDKRHDWEDLQRIVPDLLAAGFVGCPFICPDMVGGGSWTTFLPGAAFSQELFIRSAQVQALAPMMQISASPWRVLDAEHQAIFKSVVALRQRFAPDFVKLARESARTGEPMMRNLEYAFPGCGYAKVRDEFMMGASLLVAPVVEKGATSRQVVLPPGRWRADDGRVYEGPATVRIDAPLARLPYFTRESISSAGNDAGLLEGLIRIPSVSADIPQVNRAVRFLRDRLADDGLFCSVETMPDGREVLFAATVETKTPDVLLSAHLDVVPAQSPDQFVPRRENGRIYGRGASDCKEHCVLAARLMRELKGKVSVGCIFGSDEEMGGTSTSFMLDGGYGAKKLVIVMDSEQYAITTRQKGLAYYRITKTHPPRHGGMVKGPLPNAAVELMKGYQDLAAMFPTHEDGSWRDLVSLVSISGGASKAELTVSLRTADFGSWDRLEGLVREKLGGEMICLRKGDPVRLDEKESVLCEFRERMRAKWPDRNVDFYHLNSSTDARHLQRLGLPMLIIGVDARGAHSPDEYVILSSLDEHADLIKGYLVDRFEVASRKE